mmetsp:Transcript_53017/g.124462  ORF Transcript_53017/g.124462 Transcript_53017/m.124462 type:complete len:81 (-) Transcript_53017:32-274(-)
MQPRGAGSRLALCSQAESSKVCGDLQSERLVFRALLLFFPGMSNLATELSGIARFAHMPCMLSMLRLSTLNQSYAELSVP